jgi:hypothetical protein
VKQVDQAPLRGAVQFVGSRVEVADQRPGEELDSKDVGVRPCQRQDLAGAPPPYDIRYGRCIHFATGVPHAPAPPSNPERASVSSDRSTQDHSCLLHDLARRLDC